MKLSYRILFINFAVVVLIIGSSAVAFYSIMYNVLTSQQSKYLTKSTSDFIYASEEILQKTDSDFLFYLDNPEVYINSLNKNLDFIFRYRNGNILTKVFSEQNVYLPGFVFTLGEFRKDNPYTLIKKFSRENETYIYGKVLNQEILTEISRKINADVALIWDNSVSEISNQAANQTNIFLLNEACRKLKSNKDLVVTAESFNSEDIVASLYTTSRTKGLEYNLEFLIFSKIKETVSLRTSLKSVLIVIGVAGALLAVILTIILTYKIRKQINLLSHATEITRTGNFKNRISIESKDEIGKLAGAFNNMLDELEKHERIKEEYSEFITLLNQNPTLKEISDTALRKIIRTCGFVVGALYLVESEDEVTLANSYGLQISGIKEEKLEIFRPVIRNREVMEINSKKSLPLISTNLLSLEIKSLLIVPVVYNSKVIAILELGSLETVSSEVREYLRKIQEQLAIGLMNALAFVQLENLVAELKRLNEDYQKQNVQIKRQNDTLITLHSQLKEKAEELEVQKEKAEESTRLKSQFLASMSHELRTPMNSILGLTELILETSSLKDKNKERLEVVLRSGRRLMTLINDILDLSKIEAGKMEIREEDLVLDEIIDDVENSISPLILNRNLAFKINREVKRRLMIRTDRGKVTQVLLNLLSNSLKFTEAGLIEMVISEADGFLQFEIRDSGIGISEEHQKIIFEEFRQIDGTTTRKYSGTGLGLSICRKIAELLGGSVSVHSSPGKGSIFKFLIPMKIVELKGSRMLGELKVEKLIRNRNNPVLIIDDDKEAQYTIGQYLISHGYEVIYAQTGEEGLAKAEQAQPFAITLDVMLPNEDGWSILRKLKDNPETRDIPVIIVSVLGDKTIGYSLGAYEYFVKPISPDKLLSAFSRLVDASRKKFRKIVIVDDDETEFEKLKEAFKNDDIRIEYIKDSALAFNKILEGQPDLVIADLLMPGTDGISLSQKLKLNRETTEIPLIINTAKDLAEAEKMVLSKISERIIFKSGMHHHILIKTVRDYLGLQGEMPGKETIKADFPEGANKSGNEVSSSACTEKDHAYKGEVLIVDDDPETLFTLSEIIEACDYKTVLAKSGIECLEKLEKKLPGLILLDIMMPVMDGFQTLKKIRENINWSAVPVFAVTAKAMIKDREVILRNGFDDYIAKPVNSGTIAFKIEKLFITKLS